MDGSSELPAGLKSLQETVDSWIKAHGGYFSELNNNVVLVEEEGGFARHIFRTYGEQTYKAGEDPGKMADELADVLFVLVCLANQTVIDLTDAVTKNLEKKNLRDAERHRKN